jgi:hypothetical protein
MTIVPACSKTDFVEDVDLLEDPVNSLNGWELSIILEDSSL